MIEVKRTCGCITMTETSTVEFSSHMEHLRNVAYVSYITQGKYASELSDAICRSKGILRQKYFIKVKNELCKIWSRQGIDDVVLGVLNGQQLVFHGYSSLCESIQKTAEEYRQLLSNTCKFLFISAPSSSQEVAIDRDMWARKLEYDECVHRICFHQEELEREMKINVTRKEVYSEDAIKQTISDFIRKTAKNAEIVVIVFNGHGTEEGFNVDVNTFVPLIKIVDFLEASWMATGNAYVSSKRLELIFSQCFGHMFSPVKLENMSVRSFSSAEQPFTMSTVSSHPNDLDEHNLPSIIKSDHFELNMWACSWIYNNTTINWIRCTQDMVTDEDVAG